MERILLVADYPNLTELKFFNFNHKVVSRYFTDQSPFRRIFQQQIIDLILVFKEDMNKISVKDYTIDVYGYIMKFFENLKHLSITGSYPYYFPPLELHHLPLTTLFSSTLDKLCIHVMRFEDCLALLDGRLKQLKTLIVDICCIEYPSWRVYNMDDLPNLKYFSLTSVDYFTNKYDTGILPLFRRMSNLEELNLYIMAKDRTTFLDGTHIYNEILVHMPRLQIFNFYISTLVGIDPLVRHLSKDDIQRTLSNNIKYQQVDCIVNYEYNFVKCHVFSLPFMFEDLYNIGNTFPNVIFSHVRRLSVIDIVPFNHEFFNRIACSFPLLKDLGVVNFNPQSSISDERNSNDNQLYLIVKLNYLISLYLVDVHIDYVDQFLNERKTHLPRLTELTIDYDHLTIVTDNFTRDTTRLNCINVKELNSYNTRVQQSKDFYVYFPLLKP
ncbi:unnamed protein product [Rotaria sp. Silwood1]|nr:unnamed protein product [Rotaria sp. Silwood1]CAF1478885.1 unnamed protein product [Rotaria sp. Silwood1]